jgi:hypothetical protein
VTRPAEDGRTAAATAVLTPEHNQHPHSAAAAAAAQTRDPKADATRVARAALAGVELVRLADGSWAASRWGLFRCLADDAELDAWLNRVGGAR